jgi:glycosyltransferase involved in cell wall biosynthesis
VKILVVAHSFPRHARDMAGAFLLSLARELGALGHELMVVAPHAAGLPEHDTLEGVRVERFRYAPDEQETLAYAGTMHEQVLRSWRARARLISFVAASRRAVREATRRFRADIVHAHWWFPGGLVLWPPMRGAPPAVLTSHGTDLFLLDRFAAARVLARRVFAAAAQVTVISTPLVPRVRALGVADDRITVVPMPLDRAVFASSAGEGPATRLLFVGRLIERKGAEYALRALAELVRQGREVTLTMVGDGPERSALEALARQLGVAERARFEGALPPDEVARRYRECGILVMPAVTDWKGEQEGFGMVLVEGMAAGITIVATRSGGIPDVIRDSETGLLVPERDAGAIAHAIGRLLDDAPLRARLAGHAAHDVRERFDPARIARTFEAVYRRALAERA